MPHEPGERRIVEKSLATIAKERLPFIIATGGEFIALYFWLYFFEQQDYWLATFLLWLGFLIERVAVLYWVKVNFGDDVGIAAKQKPLWKKAFGLFLICLSEITVWVIFFWTYRYYGLGPAFVVLFIGEQLEHSMELGLLSKTSMWKYVFSWDATFITVLEAVGGTVWIYLFFQGQPQLGGLAMLTGLTIEHVVQGNAIKHKLQAKDKGKGKSSQSPPPASSGKDAAGLAPLPVPQP